MDTGGISTRPNTALRFGRAVVLRIANNLKNHEYARLVRPIQIRWRERGFKGFPLTITFVIAATSVWLALNTHWGYVHLYEPFSERGRYPWGVALLHLIPSMFAPARNLPIWGAIIQISLCFAAAESILGTRVALVVGLGAHCLATLAGRLFIWLGPKVIFGIPALFANVRDNGPSAATIALAIFLAWKTRSWLLGLGITLFVLSEGILIPGLTNEEHLVAMAFATVAYALWQGWNSIPRHGRQSAMASSS